MARRFSSCQPGRSSTSGSGRRRCLTCRGISGSSPTTVPGTAAPTGRMTPRAYDFDVQVRHALAVLDATGTEKAVVIGLSQGSAWALQLAAEHGPRVLGAILISSSLAITDGHPAATLRRAIRPSFRRRGCLSSSETRWSTGSRTIRRTGRHTTRTSCGSSSACVFPNHTRPSRSRTASAGDSSTTPDVLTAEAGGARPSRETVEAWCRDVTCPVLAIHGSNDMISPPLARTTARRADRWRVRRLGGRWPHPTGTRTGASQPPDSRVRGIASPRPEAIGRGRTSLTKPNSGA